MPSATERLLFENEAFRLTSTRLEEDGLTAELLAPDLLRITRGGESRDVVIPRGPASEHCPSYHGDIPVLGAMYAMAAHELQADLTADGLLRAGANWPTAWTRDVAYAAVLGTALAAPEATKASLISRVRDSVILQDTGTGGSWPVSSDRVSWALGAWALYQNTGDRDWLAYAADVLLATLRQDAAVLSSFSVLRPGETSFLDWREQSYPDWMSMAEIGASYAFGTNVLHCVCRRILAKMLCLLGREKEAEPYREESAALAKAIHAGFWRPSNKQYGMYRTAGGYLSESTDALATSLAVLGSLSGQYAAECMRHLPLSPYGTPVFSPYKSSQKAAYHNRAVWPFVEAFVLRAHAEQQNMGFAERSMACLLRAAMAFGSNKENFHAQTGEAEGTLLNSDRQLWSVAGMLSLFYYGIFGIHIEDDHLVFAPCVPKGFRGSHWLAGLRVRDMVLDIHVNGYGTEICSFSVNGKMDCPMIPLETSGRLMIELELMPMDGEEAPMQILPAVEDLPAPQWDGPTPIALKWLPVEAANSYCVYADGEAIGITADCRYPLSFAGDYYHKYRVQALNAHASSALSLPYVSLLAGACQRLLPERIGKEAEYNVENGEAWLDTRACTSRLDYAPPMLTAGRYMLRFRYSNATASKRDGDTCALRELFINGKAVAVLAFPHNTEAGNWADSSYTAPLRLDLPGGRTSISLRYNEKCRNMNGEINQCMLRELELIRIS